MSQQHVLALYSHADFTMILPIQPGGVVVSDLRSRHWRLHSHHCTLRTLRVTLTHPPPLHTEDTEGYTPTPPTTAHWGHWGLHSHTPHHCTLRTLRVTLPHPPPLHNDHGKVIHKDLCGSVTKQYNLIQPYGSGNVTTDVAQCDGHLPTTTLWADCRETHISSRHISSSRSEWHFLTFISSQSVSLSLLTRLFVVSSLSVCLSLCLCVRLSVCLLRDSNTHASFSVILSIHMSACLSLCLSLCWAVAK